MKIGIDLGGTKTEGILIDNDGNELEGTFRFYQLYILYESIQLHGAITINCIPTYTFRSRV